MKLSNLIRKRRSEAVATAIPATEPGSRTATVAKVATIAVATVGDRHPDKPPADDTPPVQASGWLLHFLDREPMEVWYGADVHHREVLAQYGGAVAAVPVPARVGTRTATLIERDELLALIAAIYGADTDADRRQALDAALADPEAALRCYRSIAAERGILVALLQSAQECAQQSVEASLETSAGCSACRHRKRPGLSAGYCAERDDLPPAYTPGHPVKKLPADLGATCASYAPHE